MKILKTYTKRQTKICGLRRLKKLGCSKDDLIDVFKQQILSITEFGAACWGPMITKKESILLERIFKTALHIIFQNEYISFEHSRRAVKLETLSQRRKNIIQKFCYKAEKSEVFRDWFCEDSSVYRTRKKKNKYKPVPCRTHKYERSPLPVLTKAASWHPPLVYVTPNVH